MTEVWSYWNSARLGGRPVGPGPRTLCCGGLLTALLSQIITRRLHVPVAPVVNG